MNDAAIPIAADDVVLSAALDLDNLRELLRFAELGRVSASLLHEISNPLSATILHLDQYTDQQALSIKHAQRNIRLLQRYVESARQQLQSESRPRRFALQTEIEQARRLLTPNARRKGIKLQFTTIAGQYLYGDPVKFQQIVTNLVTNAIDAYVSDLPVMAEGVVRLELQAVASGIILEVSDRGCGILPEQVPKLFDPFYSTKSSAGLGLGIGLSTVKRYIEFDFNGSVGVTSSPRRGTCFRVQLPYPAPKK